ncbi:MAG: hypothetical protein J4431_02300 [Candidatus Aenigmarchaeota archaeon]|nr:hypothetical protein [Candidatus Aenigmarchaeota archaeon]
MELLNFAVVVYGLLTIILLFFFTYMEAYRHAKNLTGVYRNFIISLLHSALFVDLAGMLYFGLRLHQLSAGLDGLLIVDVLMSVISTILFALSYPYLLDKIKEMENLYG